MCDPNPQTQYSTASKPEGRNTIRIPPRIGRGPRTVWLSDHLKYEDYSYLDDDDDDDDEIIIDLTKYPIGPSGRPIAGSKRVAAALQHGHGSESSLRPVNLPEGTAVNTTLGSNSVKEMGTQSLVATAVGSESAPWSNNSPAFHGLHESHTLEAMISDEAVMEG